MKKHKLLNKGFDFGAKGHRKVQMSALVKHEKMAQKPHHGTSKILGYCLLYSKIILAGCNLCTCKMQPMETVSSNSEGGKFSKFSLNNLLHWMPCQAPQAHLKDLVLTGNCQYLQLYKSFRDSNPECLSVHVSKLQMYFAAEKFLFPIPQFVKALFLSQG